MVMRLFFYNVILLQWLLLAAVTDALNETNATSADIAPTEQAPLSFRTAVAFVVAAGVLCLILWFVFLKCKYCTASKPKVAEVSGDT
jgi:hypothetical protein